MNLIKRQKPIEWSPIGDLDDFRRELNRLFEWPLSSRGDERLMKADYFPALDLTEEEDSYLVRFDLPGLTREDVEISILGNQLVVRGERKTEQTKSDKGYRYAERSFGKFQRTIELPAGVLSEKVSAVFDKGVLQIHLPKSEKVKPRVIEVKDGS